MRLRLAWFLVWAVTEPSSSEPCLAILGPGLLGGSLAMAVREVMPETRVQVWARRSEVLDAVRERTGCAVATTDVAEAAAGATLVVLATPVENMATLARELAALPLEPTAIITDVGSVKGSVTRELAPLFETTSASFIGSHPMAGSEKSGIEAARADLFRGAACIVTPEPHSPSDRVKRLEAFWRAVGCRMVSLNADVHDHHVARVSHLPHFMASITRLAALKADGSAAACIGPGFRDTTRVADGDPDLWVGIARQNRAELQAALRDARANLDRALELLATEDDAGLHQFLSEARALRG